MHATCHLVLAHRLNAEGAQAAPFQKGRFTWITEANHQEKWIVASVGKYTVLWNFRCACEHSLRQLHTLLMLAASIAPVV